MLSERGLKQGRISGTGRDIETAVAVFLGRVAVIFERVEW